MKKGLRKLILSGTALAAVAATLGTSTYAWYTANETVSATDITGTSQAAADASIFISKDKTIWSSKVSMTGSRLVSGVDTPWVEGGQLLPVEFISDSTDHTVTFKDLGKTTNTAEEGQPAVYSYTQGSTRNVAGGAAKKFTLYFRTSQIAEGATAPTVYLKNITLRNTTVTSGDGAYTGVDNMYYTGTDALKYGVNQAQGKYGVDFTQALKMVAYSNAAAGTSTPGLAAGNVNDKSLDLAAFQQTTLNSATSFSAADANALGYYNEVMGEHLTTSMDARQNKAVIAAANTYNPQGEDTTKRVEISLGQLKGDTTEIAVDFYIYLDGWDEFCYDACKGQSFDITLEFTSDVKQALTYAGTQKAQN